MRKSMVCVFVCTMLAMGLYSCGTKTTSPSSISITKSGVVQVGKPPVQLTATNSNGTDVTAQVTWSSDYPEIASIDSSGLVTGHMAGHVTITATMNDQTATLSITSYVATGPDV